MARISSDSRKSGTISSTIKRDYCENQYEQVYSFAVFTATSVYQAKGLPNLSSYLLGAFSLFLSYTDTKHLIFVITVNKRKIPATN